MYAIVTLGVIGATIGAWVVVAIVAVVSTTEPEDEAAFARRFAAKQKELHVHACP
jgi:hypothetical protein